MDISPNFDNLNFNETVIKGIVHLQAIGNTVLIKQSEILSKLNHTTQSEEMEKIKNLLDDNVLAISKDANSRLG